MGKTGGTAFLNAFEKAVSEMGRHAQEARMSEEITRALHGIADELVRRRSEIIEADTSLGFTYRHSNNQINTAVRLLKNYQRTLLALRNRRGICRGEEEIAFLFPYNFSAIICVILGAQIALGNKVRAKASELTKRSAIIMEDIFRKHCPDQVRFDYRPGPQFMDWAVEDPRIKLIVFYGSHLVALQYLRKIYRNGKKFIFEGPGKNPFIVANDADISSAALALKQAKYRASGQLCWSPGLLYIQDEIYDDFLDRFIQITKDLNVGEASDPDTDIGPLGSPLAVKRIQDQLDDAKAKGAKVVTGGKIERNLVVPTVITHIDNSMLGVREESFGPILWVIRFRTAEEAVKLAGDNVFGLAMAVCGYEDAQLIVDALKGPDYLHEVPDFVFGKYGMVFFNPDAAPETAFEKAVAQNALFEFGGYGYSGWVCDTLGGRFRFMQGPKNMEIETSEVIRGERVSSYLG
jgi:betaine-aldehyde dehydrogenase